MNANLKQCDLAGLAQPIKPVTCRRLQSLQAKSASQGRSLSVYASAAATASQSVFAPAESEVLVTKDERLPQRNSAKLISQQTIKSLEAELDNGPSVAALRRFNRNLRSLKPATWAEKLLPVMNELAYNLESFNPAFTAVLLKAMPLLCSYPLNEEDGKAHTDDDEPFRRSTCIGSAIGLVQCCIGKSDYVRRDMALKNLIQPLAGEYGMHNGQEQAKTHRELFSEFYEDLLKSKLESALAVNPEPSQSVALFQQMMSDIQNGSKSSDVVDQAAYAMGYNLAIEYLADYEKTWMLDSFRALNDSVLVPQGRPLTKWTFLEVHAEGEAEHAAIGHQAVAGFVPACQTPLVRKAMQDHDRDFAVFYNALADLLQ